MVCPTKVKPQKYSKVEVLYDDGGYGSKCVEAISIAKLTAHGDDTPFYGIRWNGTGDAAGYPSQGGNPLWFEFPYSVDIDALLPLISVLMKDKFNK